MTLYAKSFEYICFLEPPHISRTSCPDKPWQFRYLKRVHILQAVFQTLLAAIVFRTFLAVFRTILAAFRTLLAAFHTLLATFRALRTRNRDSSLHLFKPKFFLLHCQVHFLEFFQTGGFQYRFWYGTNPGSKAWTRKKRVGNAANRVRILSGSVPDPCWQRFGPFW